MLFKKITVFCPYNWVTGGTEALHQLVHVINSFGGNASICYYTKDKIGGFNKVPLGFRYYNLKIVSEIEDSDEHTCVIPESYSTLLNTFQKSQVILWWLSVDYNNFDLGKFSTRKDILHVYQSEYAKLFLLKNGQTNIKRLSDYVIDFNLRNKKSNLIFLNSNRHHKDYHIQNNENFSNFNWEFSSNYSRLKLRRIFATTSFYIDFGFFPGKDRMPREAILQDNLVFLSNQGASENDEDFNIDKKFKKKPSQLKELAAEIKDLNQRNSFKNEKFDEVKTQIQSEFQMFCKDVCEVFNLNWKEFNGVKMHNKRLMCYLYLESLFYPFGIYYNAPIQSRTILEKRIKQLVHHTLRFLKII